MSGAISDRSWLRVGSPAIIHHTAEHPSGYDDFGRAGEGWLVVDRRSRCLVSVHGPYPTRETARAEMRRLKTKAEAGLEARLMASADRRRLSRLSELEAQRALYIDFEGEKDKPPVLLGVLRRAGRGERPFVHVDVVDDAFASLGASTRSLHDAVAVVVRRAEHEDRRIVAWSEHDLNVVRALRDEDPDIVARFEARYANARLVARRWRNKLHGGDNPESGRLVDYLALIAYPLPDEAIGGEVGDTIRILRRRLEQGLELTAPQRARRERLVEHNRHDCAGMRRLCLVAAQELEAAD